MPFASVVIYLESSGGSAGIVDQVECDANGNWTWSGSPAGSGNRYYGRAGALHYSGVGGTDEAFFSSGTTTMRLTRNTWVKFRVRNPGEPTCDRLRITSTAYRNNNEFDRRWTIDLYQGLDTTFYGEHPAMHPILQVGLIMPCNNPVPDTSEWVFGPPIPGDTILKTFDF